MTLPTTKSLPKFDFELEKILLYGDPKIGKTTLVAALPYDILFIATEAGHNKVEAYVKPIEDWTEFEAVIKEVKASAKFRMLAIDTIDALWYLYLADFLKKNNVQHEGFAYDGYGKGYDVLIRNFANHFLNLQHTGKGYFLLAHTRVETFKVAGQERQRIEPNLPIDKYHKMRDAIQGTCDYILYMTTGIDVKGKEAIPDCRIIRTSPSEGYMAGARHPLPDPIPLINGDPAKSAMRLVNAYKISAKQKTTEEVQNVAG